MSPPTATKGGWMNWLRSSTSFHSPPVKLKTTHSWEGQQVGRGPITTAIAWLAGPVNGPQSSCKTGSGRRKPFRSCSAISWRAVDLVHGPEAVGVAKEIEAVALTNTTTNAATLNGAVPNRRGLRTRPSLPRSDPICNIPRARAQSQRLPYEARPRVGDCGGGQVARRHQGRGE